MAYIGMQHVVGATITTETEGSPIVYGTGMVLGKAISGNITWNRSDNPLYADDAIAENDNGITGGDLELGVDDLTDEAMAYALGETKKDGTQGAPDVYETTDAAAPYMGVGYVRVRRKAGVTTYQAVWILKTQFGLQNEEAQTKGETIEWQTPTLNGTIFGVKNDATLMTKYRERATFATLAEAVAWLDGKANI